jgi:hypothetical protein
LPINREGTSAAAPESLKVVRLIVKNCAASFGARSVASESRSATGALGIETFASTMRRNSALRSFSRSLASHAWYASAASALLGTLLFKKAHMPFGHV